MTLPLSCRDASHTAMMRLFALIMIYVLSLSHGSASAAMPHASLDLHASEHSHVFDLDADYSVALQHAANNDDSGGEDTPEPGRDVAHAHVSVDMVPYSGAVVTQLLASANLHTIRPVGPLASIDPAPLLEPPSA